MKKIFLSIIFVSLFLFNCVNFNIINASENKIYSYEITSNDISLEGIIELYKVKEEFIINYNNSLNENQKITEIYHTFSSCDIKLIDDCFYVTIGKGGGIKLTGKLKNDNCDSSAINYRIGLLEWLNK